jgi:hypothetical protein
MLQGKYTYLSIIVALATLLHGYESLVAWRESSEPGVIYWALGVFLWSMTPYALCAIVASLSVHATPANVGASVALLFDLAMHHEIFVSTSSTVALGFILMPFWNLILLAPLSIFLAHWVMRKSRSGENAP